MKKSISFFIILLFFGFSELYSQPQRRYASSRPMIPAYPESEHEENLPVHNY